MRTRFDGAGEQAEVMAEINMIPLIDVMLVLLIIFMVTAPLFTHAVKIDLPRAASEVAIDKPETIALAIDGQGILYWNDDRLSDAELPARLAAAAAREPQPELHLRADRDTRYEVVARVMSAARRAGVQRIGFVTDPAEQRR